MSQDVDNSNQFNGYKSTQLKNKDENNGKRVIVQKPNVLKELGLIHKIEFYKSKPKVDDDITEISPVIIDNGVKKIMQKVLKPTDSSQMQNNIDNDVRKKKTVEMIKKNVNKTKSPLIQWLKSNEIVNEQSQDNIKHYNVSIPSSSKSVVPKVTQSSIKSNCVSQIDDAKDKSMTTLTLGKFTSNKTKTPSLKIKKIPCKSLPVNSLKKSTVDTKSNTGSNKITSNVSIFPMSDNLIFEDDETFEKRCILESKKIALLKKKYKNSPEPSSSSSQSKKLLTNKQCNVGKLVVFKINTDKKLSSENVIKNSEINTKNEPVPCKCSRTIQAMNEEKLPSAETSWPDSRFKNLDKINTFDVIDDNKNGILKNVKQYEGKRLGIMLKNQPNISNNDESKIKKVDEIRKDSSIKIAEVMVKKNKSHIVNTLDNFLENKKKDQQQPQIPSEKLSKKSKKKIKNNATPIYESQLFFHGEIDKSSSTSQHINELESNKIKSETNQSKNQNDNLKKNHDKAKIKDEKINVPDVTDTMAVLDVPLVKRGRGRPRKVITNAISELNSTVQKPKDECSKVEIINEVDSELTARPLGRKRNMSAKKIEMMMDELKDGETDTAELDDEKHVYRRNRGGCRGRRRGRPSIRKIDTDYTPRKSEINHSEVKSRIDTDTSESETITCGKCKEEVAENQWSKHNLNKHNNMGWQEGDSVPDYENNEILWRRILNVAHKRRKGSLICEKCCTIKRSVIGFISHYQFCGKTVEERKALKWTCPQCHGEFMPSSQEVHERMHRDIQRNNKTVLAQMTVNNDDDGTRKRKAATKAATKISEFTVSIKDDDEPKAKKIKMNTVKVKNLITQPRKSDLIPSVWRGFWKRAIAANKEAQCRQPGCTFSTKILNEIYEHCSKCKFKPIPTFTCKVCKYLSDTLEGIVEHVKEHHANQINKDESDFCASDSNDDSDENNIPIESSRNRKSTSAQCDKASKFQDRAAFIRNEKYYYEDNIKMTFVPALQWTLDFELKNYNLLLFENFQPNDFILLTNDEAEDYIPKLTVSMRVKQMNQLPVNLKNDNTKIDDGEWKTWKRFESSVVNGFPTFFVGGPVWSMAWLPIPAILYSENVNQYIAISTHSKMNDTFIVGKSYKFKNIIQIWNLGHLNHTPSNIPQNPKFAYAIAHDKGTIWCMEWCPSGAYENSFVINDNRQGKNYKRRMGLLAVASSDGCVHIYSTVFPEELNFHENNNSNLPIYKTDPIITLQTNQLLHERNEINWQCITLNWSKTNSHEIIAAGFTNGYVALWDLTTKSPLLMKQNKTTTIINSYRHFYAHKQSVTGITIIPLKEKRFLATTSIDRSTKFWDLENIHNCIDAITKGVAVNSAWMTHWPNIFTCYDDVLGLGHTVTYLIGLRESYSKSLPILPTNSPTYGIAASDYANAICHGTSAGELVAMFPFQMLYFRDMEKLSKKRWLVSSIKIVDFNASDSKTTEVIKEDNKKLNTNLKEHVYMPDTYEKCSERFGIIFHDDVNNVKKIMSQKSRGKNPLNSDTMTTVPVEQYNFTSINRTSWNPNAWSYLWFGTGYQNGFIRILHFKSMSMKNPIAKLLPDHKIQILNKEKKKKEKMNFTSDA